MADFRKWILVLAVLALAGAFAVPASAQNFQCATNTGVTPTVRGEGLAELVGDIILTCTNGTPGATFLANVQVFLNTNVTSRLVPPTGVNATEALLLIQEPSPLASAPKTYENTIGKQEIFWPAGNFQPCVVAPGSTNTNSCGGTAGAPYYLPNVFQGTLATANSVVFLGVPFTPPGTGNFVVRITNIRANAQQLGVSSTLIPSQIVAYISISGTTSVALNNPQQTVAFVQPGLQFQIRQCADVALTAATRTFNQCTATNNALAGDPTTTGATLQANVKFIEGFANSFKAQVANTFGQPYPGQLPFCQDPTFPNLSGSYNSESGFMNSGFGVTSGGAFVAGCTPGNAVLNVGSPPIGYATQGTRLLARFTNIPAGVQLFVTTIPVGDGTTGITLDAKGNPVYADSAKTQLQYGSAYAVLLTTDANGNGPYVPTSPTGTAGCCGVTTTGSPCPAGTGNTASVFRGLNYPIAPVTITNGTGVAVWEVLYANPFVTESISFGVSIAYKANTASNLPGLGSANVGGNLAPISTVTTASATAPVPRFADLQQSVAFFTIQSCRTSILFPFVTAQSGFDTGIAISNTSLDDDGTGSLFSTAKQTGACTLHYFGSTAGGGAAPPPQTSSAMKAGDQLVFTLSNGGNFGINATPGFQGYMIAQCQFQYAHAFAFISDLGAQRLAEGYLGLVMDPALSATYARTAPESLTH